MVGDSLLDVGVCCKSFARDRSQWAPYCYLDLRLVMALQLGGYGPPPSLQSPGRTQCFPKHINHLSYPPIQWVPGFISLGTKKAGHEAMHSSPSSAEVRNKWSYTSKPTFTFMSHTGRTLPYSSCPLPRNLQQSKFRSS